MNETKVVFQRKLYNRMLQWKQEEQGSEKNEAELKRKADEKGKRYYGIPHDSKRWRMIVGNVMLEMIGER